MKVVEAPRSSSIQIQPPIRFKRSILMTNVMIFVEPLNFKQDNEHKEWEIK